MINPKHLAGQPAPMLGEEEIASFSESYGFAAEDLRQPYHVKVRQLGRQVNDLCVDV